LAYALHVQNAPVVPTKQELHQQVDVDYEALLTFIVDGVSVLVLGRYTKYRTDIRYFEIPIPTPTSVFKIPKNTEYRQLNTENTESRFGICRRGTENFITERVHIICMLNLYINVIYNLNIVDCLFRVLDVVLHCIRVQLVIASYVYSNNHNAANNNDLSVIPPGTRIINFPIPNPGIIEKKAPGLQSLISPTRLPNIWLKYLQP